MNPKHIILLICAGHSERWITRTVVDNGDIPWHFTARKTKFHCRQSPKCKWMNRVRICSYWARKSQQRRVMWQLREGVFGVDCVRDAVAPSANELAWFYMGSDIGLAVGVPEAWSHAALSYRWKRTEKHKVKVMTEMVCFSRKCSENFSEKHNLKRNVTFMCTNLSYT